MEFKNYVGILNDSLAKCLVTGRKQKAFSVQGAISLVVKNVIKCGKAGKKVMFVGNGGSASIASHMAVDFWKNALVPAFCFNDPAQLTCLANDYGYEKVFSAPIEIFAGEGDILFAISSSGQSLNIFNAVQSARKKKCWVITLAGFRPDNPLRKSGDINFYIPDDSYGIVESAHSIICHHVLDAIIHLRNRDKTSS